MHNFPFQNNIAINVLLDYNAFMWKHHFNVVAGKDEGRFQLITGNILL